MKQYLLGAAPPAETERLDELSVSDGGIAERLQMLENDLVDAYVRGELSGQTLVQFNSFYLASPTRRQKVQFAQALRTVAERNMTRTAPSLVGRAASAERRGWRRVFAIPQRAGQWAVATATAALLLVTLTGWLAIENRRLQGQRDAALADRRAAEQHARRLEAQLAKGSPPPEQKPQPPPDSPIILAFNLAPQTRGVSQIPVIAIPAGADYVSLQLELESAGYPAWRAQIKALPRREPVWRSGRLSAHDRNENRIVAVSFPPRLLHAQVYVVELAGITPSGSEEPAASYPFRVILK
jgi:hypothetical protein